MSTEGVEQTTTEEAAKATTEEAAKATDAVEKTGDEAVAVDSAPGSSAVAESAASTEPERSPEEDIERKRRRRAHGVGDAVMCRPLEVVVRDDRVEQAIRQLKNRMAREGVLRELKNRRHYFKPSELKRIKSREAARRRRKQARQKGAH